MTQSPPPSDQGWSDPSAQSTSQPPASGTYATTGGASHVATVERPGRVLWGSIVLIVLGALTILVGLLALLGGAMLSGAASGGLEGVEGAAGFQDMFGAFAGALVVIAAIVLIWGIVEIVAAANALGGKGWARITGIVLSAVGGLFVLLGLIGSMTATASADAQQAQQGGAGGIVMNVLLLAAYAFVIWAYASAGQWFSSRSR